MGMVSTRSGPAAASSPSVKVSPSRTSTSATRRSGSSATARLADGWFEGVAAAVRAGVRSADGAGDAEATADVAGDVGPPAQAESPTFSVSPRSPIRTDIGQSLSSGCDDHMTGLRLPLRLRADAVEMLDAPSLDLHDVERNLADLARLNRLPGGVEASARAIDGLLDGRNHARILDAGAGRADMPVAFARRGWEATALDSHPGVLGVARRVTG